MAESKLAVLVSDAETGLTVLVPEGRGKGPEPTRTNERAAALIYCSGRLLDLFRDALNCVSGVRWHPDQLVFEVLAIRAGEGGGPDYYGVPPWGGLELYYPDTLSWCTGRGHPPALREFVERMVDFQPVPPLGMVREVFRQVVERMKEVDVAYQTDPGAEGRPCEVITPDTGSTEKSCNGSPATSSPRPAAG